MFCPKCATQNNEGAKFCRLCGADISLISHAMTGQIPKAITDDNYDDRKSRRERKRERPPSVERGVKSLFMGIGFLLVAFALSRSREGFGWWYWMLIPAFSMIGGGVAEFLRARTAHKGLPFQSSQTQAAMSDAPHVNVLPPRNTNELVAPPPSVTEGTTRHLGSEGPTKVFVPAERPKEH